MFRRDTYGFGSELVAHFIFLRFDSQHFLVHQGHFAVVLHQLVYQRLRDFHFGIQLFGLGIADAPERLSTNAYIDFLDGGLQLFFQLADDRGKTLCGLVQVVDNAFPDAIRRVFAGVCEDVNASVGILLACNAGDFA